MSKNIILVDKRIQNYETIIAAIDPALAVGIVFDYYNDTFDNLKTYIGSIRIGITSESETNATAGISVGLVQHNYRSPMFGMVASADLAPVANVAIQDPDLALWTQFRDFIMWCKTEHSAAYFDMMACALYSYPDWKYVIDTLTSQTGVTIRASTDDTGSATLGGDWFLESHTGVNLKDVYFTESIDEYRGVLYIAPYSIRKYPTKGFAIGNVVAWGESTYGGAAPSSVTAANSGVVAVYSTGTAFAALKTDGSVVAWGNSGYGGAAPSSVTTANSGVVAVYSNYYAFVALKTNGSVVAWGNFYYGGTGNAPSSVTAANSGVVAVYSTKYAFAALKTDGSVVAWGDSSYGGNAPSSVTAANSGVVAVYANDRAFAALKTDGSVVAWGNANNGGTTPGTVSSGVVAVYSTKYAFAALKTDGSVVAWGDPNYGGDGAPSSVTAANSGVVAVYSATYAFAALKTDGSVVAWGDSSYGGSAPSSVTAANSGVVAVYSAEGAFAALKTDGSVVAWGDNDGSAPSSVTAANSGVVAVYSNQNFFFAFAALKPDGSVVAWGNSSYGGIAPSSVTTANSGVVAVYVNQYAFAALKTTASTFDLNMSYYTDMDRYNILRKQENRRRVNLTTLNNDVFTLSQARDLQTLNSLIPTDKIFHIIVPAYTSSPLSITSSATIPSSYNLGSVIIACDESEPVIISGTTYINYGSLVYTVNASGSYVKTTSATINGLPYSLYGGDGINSSGIALLDARQNSTITTFIVASSKIIGDEPFAITTRPTSNSGGAITYSSSNTSVATIDASGDFITIVGGGDVSFIATQEGTIDYAPTTKTSNTLSVTRLTSTFSSSTFEVASSKTYGDASFNITTAPTSDSNGEITYSSSNTAVATIDASGDFINIVGAGEVTFIATQAQTSQYASSTNTSNTLTVGLGTSNLSSSSTFVVASSKTYGDAPFAITTRPTSNSSGAITYSSSNTGVATIDASGNYISLVAAGEVSFIATQAETSQYESATKTSNTLTVSKADTTLVFVSPPTSKNATDLASVLQPGFNEEFTLLTATGASSGAVTYTSNNTAIATIGLTTGLVTLMGAGGTLIITASQASTAQYNAPTNATCSIVINYIDTSLIGQTVSPGTSYAGVDFSGAILTGATLSGVSFSGASLINADLSGVVITGTNFTNANISGAINLPAFSTVQKLQLLGNLNNIAIGAIQINTQVSGADINAMLPASVGDIASATFTLKMPSALDASSNRNVTITSADISNNTSVYIPLNANQTVKINGTAFFFNGTNILDANNKVRSFLLVEGVPFKLYAGSIIALNITESLNEVKVMDDGLYNIFSALLKPRST